MMEPSKPSRRLFLAAVTLLGSLVFGLGVVSCVTDGGVHRESASGPAAHGVHSDELRNAMREMETRSKEDVAAELYTGSPTVRPAMDNVAQSAQAIARTADHIPDILASVEMAPDDHREFLALAAQLGTQARQLEAQAREGNAAAARRTRERLNATCDACHSRFRIPGY